MNSNELQQHYEIEIEFSQLDQNGYLTPAGYQYIVNAVAGKHLINYNLEFARLIGMGLSWVLLSISVDVINPIKGEGTKVVGTTWHSQRKGIFFRREISVCDENGTPLFNCATYSTLLDLETRSIYKSRTLPFELMPPTEETLLIATPSFKEKNEYEKGDSRLAQRSYIDGLGHVNNGRYGDFCFDAMDEEEARMDKLRRMEIYFVSELRLGEKFTTNKAKQDNKLVVQGYNESSDKVAFYGVFKYD